MNELTKTEQTKAALGIVLAVSETIREVGIAPAGVIYAALCGRVSFEGYEKIIGILKGAGLVAQSGNDLKWIGPAISERAN